MKRWSGILWIFYALLFPTFQNFRPNPYFEDTKLTKTFTFLDEGSTKISATSIKWKEGSVWWFCLSFPEHMLCGLLVLYFLVFYYLISFNDYV